MLALLLGLAITGPAAAEPAPADDPGTEAPANDAARAAPDDPYAVEAPLDVQTLLDDTDKAYLEAWGRLEQHPALAAEALLDRLAAVPALGPAKRKRLLDILAGLELPEHVPLFAKELRRAIVQAESLQAAEAACDRWRPLLTDQGAAAAPHLQALVGDRELPLRIRAALVGDLVEVSDDATVLVVLVGRGHPVLARALRSAMVERARRDRATGDAMRGAIDDAIDDVLHADDTNVRGSPRATGLLWLRAHIATPPDIAFVKRTAEIARDEREAFALRIASLRALGRIDSKESRTALTSIARDQLADDKRETQRGEILGWVALGQLPPAQARPVADTLALANAEAPRLATIGLSLATLGGPAPDHPWLSRALDNPWPQVRQAALARVQGPCSDGVLDRLADLGGPTQKGGDGDGAAARSATQALGRCGGPRAQTHLARQLKNDDAPMEQRAEAARQLTKHGGPDGVDVVARVLEQDIGRALARRLAAALRFAAAPTPRATQALCTRLQDGGEVARAAAVSLRQLHRGADESPCG